MASLIRKILRIYKPVDARLRRFAPYAKLSRRLQKRISARPGNRSLTKPDAAAYVENLGQVVPRKDTILFECYWGGKFADNPLAMYRELVKTQPRGKFRILWTAKNPETAPPEISENPDVTLVKLGTREYGLALLEAGYLVNNVTFPAYFIRQPAQRYCNTWHGVPIKAMGRDMNAPLISMANSQRNFLQSDVLLEMGDYYRWATIRPYFADKLAAGALVPCGAPRIDDVLAPKVAAAELRSRFGIAAHQKVVLFAPTWRGDSTKISKGAFDDQAKLFAQIAKALGDGHFVIFSAHQMFRTAAAAAVPNGKILPEEENINDVLTIVDVMVSDYSSIIFDFLPVDRPIVLFTPDLEEYRQSRGLYLGPEDLPCANATSLSALIAAIKAGKRPSEFGDISPMRARYVPYEDGHAAAKALSALLAPPNEAAAAQENKRIRLLIAPGGMMPNGITTSLKNLIANLDYDRFDPYILIDAPIMDQETKRIEQMNEFDPRCNWILRCGDTLIKDAEKSVYHGFRVGTPLQSAEDMALIREIFSREARRLMGDKVFDVAIEFGGYAPYWAGVIACSNARRKVCYQHNHLWAEYKNPSASRNQMQLYSVFELYRWYDQIVAVSDETREVNESHLAQFYPKDMVAKTVRNAMNSRRVKDRARQSITLAHPPASALFQDPDLFRFIALGRLSPEKRYDRMIGALAKIAPDYPNAVLMICGSGPLENDLKALVMKLDLQTQVQFLGQVLNPYPLLARADACVMSSDYEGQPMALLEALCLETPCIGTDIPGIRSVLKDGRGHIVKPNVDALAEAMRAAIEGRLPALQTTGISEIYENATLAEFSQIVCGL